MLLKLSYLTEPKNRFSLKVALLWFKQALSFPMDQFHQIQDVVSLLQVNQFLRQVSPFLRSLSLIPASSHQSIETAHQSFSSP